jgi:hypothetical protein
MTDEATDETKDAWLQLHELMEKFTEQWEVRRDINVTAWATHRTVELTLTREIPGMSAPNNKDWYSTGKRNVGTMRELAEAIIAACDYVEECNPMWASISDDPMEWAGGSNQDDG